MRRNSCRKHILACTAILGIAVTSTAQAQENCDPSQAGCRSDNQNVGLADIVVTAQRRAENLQDVPISVQAFSSQGLETAAANGVEDLPMLTPGLTMQRNSGGSTPFIRGIGSPTANAGNEGAVATYVDGVYRQSLYTSHLSFSDVERVEVLKGPQGTLFGRNTTGGLIQIITKDPSSTPSGNFSASIGNHEIFEVKAYGTMGLVPDVAISVGGYVRQQRDEFGTNLVTGRGASYRNENSVHGKLQFNNGITKITVAGDYSVIEDPRGFTRVTPVGAVGGIPGGPTYVKRGGFHDIDHNRDPFSNSDSYGGSVTIEHRFDALDLVSISAWRNDFTDISQDNDFTALDLSHAFIEFYTRNFTQEVRLASNGDGALSWIAGLFYLDSAAGNHLDILSGPVVATVLEARTDTKSYSAFAEAGLKVFDDRGKITLGARYTIDKRRVSGSVNGTPGFPERIGIDPTTTWKEPTYRIVYDHKLTDGVMAYASYNRGFKSGNYNIIPATTPAYKPEKLDAWEAGLKSRLGDWGRLNISAFYYKYKDLQLSISNATAVTIINAADAEIKGAEVEFSAQPVDGLTIDLGASYLDATYTSFKNAEVYIPNVDGAGNPIGGNTRVTGYDASGLRLIRTPKWTGTAGITYAAPVGDGKFTGSVRARYNGDFIWEPSGRIREGDYVVLNASLAYRWDSGIQLALEGQNMTGTKYSLYSGATALSDFYAPSDPATYSVVLRAEF